MPPMTNRQHTHTLVMRHDVCVRRRYVKFKQGEVWHAISAEFAATGLRPTAADRERLASGIELSEHLAAAVRSAQGAILGREMAAQREREARYFGDMRAQRKLEQEARFYQV